MSSAADTSLAREYHAGLAAQLGVNAALAARRALLDAAGAVLLASGVTWLAATAGGHATQVTTALAQARPTTTLAVLPTWHTLTMAEGALPPPAVVPVLSGSF